MTVTLLFANLVLAGVLVARLVVLVSVLVVLGVCCVFEVVDVLGVVLCGASRNMLVCCVCCFVARTVLMWVYV